MFWEKLKKIQDIVKGTKVLKKTDRYDVMICELCKKRKAISDCNNMLKLVYEINSIDCISKKAIKRLCFFEEDKSLKEEKIIGIMKSRVIRRIDGKIAKFSCKKYGIINKRNKRKSKE